MPGRDAVATHGPIKSVICWLHPHARASKTNVRLILNEDKKNDRKDKAYEFDTHSSCTFFR